MRLELKSIDLENNVALFEDKIKIVSVYFAVEPCGNVIIDLDNTDWHLNYDEIYHVRKIIKDHVSGSPKPYSKYRIDVSDADSIDVYDIHNRFNVDDPSGCLQHASKKILLPGTRTGGKSKYQDIKEARDTLNRWLELNKADCQ